jgi:hypothetical protein
MSAHWRGRQIAATIIGLLILAIVTLVMPAIGGMITEAYMPVIQR